MDAIEHKAGSKMEYSLSFLSDLITYDNSGSEGLSVLL